MFMRSWVYFIVYFLVVFFMMGSMPWASIVNHGLKDVATVRALGMGNAFTSIGQGAGAMVYNPAGFAIQGRQYSLQWLDYKDRHYDTYFMHNLYAQPFGYSYWKIGDSSSNYLTVNAMGYGQRGSKSIDWGVTVKRVSGEDLGAPVSGWSSDLGVIVHLLPFMDVGAVGHDIVNKDVSVSSTWATGISLFTPKRNVIIAGDVYKNESDSLLKSRFGVEYIVAYGLTVRGGWYDDNFTAGAGVILPFGEIEYGVNLPEDATIASTHMLSFRLGRGTELDQFRKQYSAFKPKSYAILELGGAVIEGKTEVSLLGGHKIGSNDLVQLIRFAREDTSCKGFIVRISQFQSRLSVLGLVDEIRQELQKAKLEGKEIIVYIDHWATLPEYYIASIADKIYMPELGTISHLGIEVEIKKTGRFLSNFGIGSISISSGAFKDRLSPETAPLSLYEKRELEGLVNDLYHYVVDQIRSSRGISRDVFESLFTGQFITGSQAKETGLIDHFAYWSDLPEMLAASEEDEIRQTSLMAYQLPKTTTTLLSLFNRIAVIEIDGPIMGGHHESDLFYGGKTTGADDIDRVVALIEDAATIRGVIVRINSPGGSVLATDQIYQAIGRLRDAGKTVYVSMGNLAASGGYYIGLNSDKIFANPMTTMGSIGVFSSYRHYEDLYDVLGIDHDVVKTGKYMSVGKSRQALTMEELTMVQTYQDRYYQHFVNRVIQHRDLSEEEVYDVAQGQVFFGKLAEQLSLVDELGGFQDTVDALSKVLNISSPRLITYRSRPKWTMSKQILGGIMRPFNALMGRVQENMAYKSK